MRSKLSVVTLFLLVCFFVPRLSFATSVTLKLETTNGSVYPYDFSIDGSKSDTALSCLNENLQVNTGETWIASATNLESDITAGKSIDGFSVGQLEADAYLDSLYGTSAGTDTEIQDAIWDIQNGDKAGGDSKSQSLYNTAYDYEIGTLTESSAFYSQFTFYDPTSWNQWGDDDQSGSKPQEFMGYTPAPPPLVPEPSSLVLLGTGLVGAAGAMRRRFVKA